MVSCSTRSAITPRRAARYLWIGARVSAMIRSSSASLIASDTGGLPVDDCEVGEPGGEGLRLILERDRVAVTGAPVGPVFPGERHLGGEPAASGRGGLGVGGVGEGGRLRERVHHQPHRRRVE